MYMYTYMYTYISMYRNIYVCINRHIFIYQFLLFASQADSNQQGVRGDSNK
jgi:hypothetical protein